MRRSLYAGRTLPHDSRRIVPQLHAHHALFPTPNRTDPRLTFSDGLYEAFNSAAGSVTAATGNLFQGRQNFSWASETHSVKAGVEFRANRDSSYFGTAPNGPTHSVEARHIRRLPIRSLSGAHDIPWAIRCPTHSPLCLPPALCLHTGRGSVVLSARRSDRCRGSFPIRHQFLQDTWKISDRLVLDYGLRYEIYTPISERAKRTAGMITLNGPTAISGIRG